MHYYRNIKPIQTSSVHCHCLFRFQAQYLSGTALPETGLEGRSIQIACPVCLGLGLINLYVVPVLSVPSLVTRSTSHTIKWCDEVTVVSDGVETS